MGMRTRWYLSLCLGLCATSGWAAEKEGKATLYRDTWGVPHIYADTINEGMFALGYAQAEDRLDDIFQAIRTGLGRMSEAYGEDYIDQDYIMRLSGNEEVCRKAWPATPPELQEIILSFRAGLQKYMEEHPEKVPDSKLDIEPWMFATVGRAMILRWPLGTIQDDLGRKNKDRGKPADETDGTNIPMRSNEWAISGARTATNGPIMHADPHMTWEGLAVLYEARVHAGDLHMCGFFLIGMPLMGYGHNSNVGWANTTGGPDTADVYELKVKPGIVPQYEYDGKWRTPKIRPQKIAVKGKEKPVIRPSAYTHLGPIVSPPEGEVAYAAATPYFEKSKLFDQFYLMNRSKNAKQFYDALGMLEYNEQNVMFADTDGTIAYVRNGATPIRPDGYDWNAPVPGHTSDTAWKGIHPIEELVQVFNPKTGYMQNCNISPAAMMKDSPLLREKFKPYIFNVADWERNPRGDRSTQLLDADKSVTKEDALAFAMDVFDMTSPWWKKGLKDAVAAQGKEKMKDAEFAAAVAKILDWNGEWTADATQTVLIKNWRDKAGGKEELKPMAKGEPLTADAQKLLVDLLSQAISDVKAQHGRWDIPFGEVFVVGRGGKYFPMNGMDFGSRGDEYNYTETLLSISYHEDKEKKGRQLAYKGSICMIVMFMHPDGVESYSATAWGQSGDPTSPHYVDQSEKLFSKRKLKPTFWKKEDLLKNLESEKTLSVKYPAAEATQAK